MFKKNVRSVYLYLVCFITLFMVIGGIIATINEIAEYVFPINYRYNNYLDNLMYDDNYMSLETEEEREEYKAKHLEIYEEENKQQSENDKRENIRDIISSLSFVIIPLPIYLLSWTKVNNERKENESAGE